MQPAVEFRAVEKHFGPVRAVDGIDLSLAPGQVVAILGPNGAGKSTSISLMLGLRPPTAGEVRILGGSPRAAATAGRVGAMLQAGGLPPGATVREIVGFTRSLYPQPMPLAEALEAAGCSAFQSRRVELLSGGEQQRVRFARAIVGRPELLFLDEPTVGLDVETRRRFWVSLRAAADGRRTVVFCTHYLDEADSEADRIVVVQHGRVLADGSGAEIKAAVAGRTVRLTCPRDAAEAVASLPGVRTAEWTGDRVALRTADADATVRALAASNVQWRDLEVGGTDLEEAFLTLTGSGDGGQDA